VNFEIIAPVDPGTLQTGTPKSFTGQPETFPLPCRCGFNFRQRFLPSFDAPTYSDGEIAALNLEGYAAPRMNILLYKPDVQNLQNRMLLAGFDIWTAMGGLAWIMPRQASWNINYTNSLPQATVRLIPVNPPSPSAYLDRTFQKGGRIQLATRIGASSPWGMNTFWQVLQHELFHWMGSPFSWWAYDWHTEVPSDLLCRAPYRRNMAEKYNHAAQTYWGLSIRELSWIRNRFGTPLIPTVWEGN
jgi:hypothetical protein